MNCPICEANGKENIGATVVTKESTMTSYPYFFDSIGQGHLHDGNITRVLYRCPFDHRFIAVRHNRCWCGWSGGEDKLENVHATPTGGSDAGTSEAEAA